MDKMQMICDPYQKTIEFRWYDETTCNYVPMNGKCAELTSPRFTKDVTIQTRADEIVHIIDEVIDPGNAGVEIHFIGTQDDFEDLRRVVEDYYAVKNIHCVQDGYCYHDAEYSIKEIIRCFDKVSGIIEKHDEEKELTEILKNYEETIKPELAICVMGLYSSGKSAFINSLVGMEVLPSASDPTTAKVCCIRNRTTYRISFSIDAQPCFMEFDIDSIVGRTNMPDDVYHVLYNTAMYKEEVSEDDTVTVVKRTNHIEAMYAVLKRLNSKSPFPGHKDGELVEIELPYTNSLLPINRFDFVIYDTPGSNSATNEEHFTVLNNALTNQTNALPVILTTPDTMDSTENDPLLNLIHNNQNKLDTTNAMIVVNKSDEKMDKALREKKVKIDGLKLTKWKSTRIFFVSALLGLASKKSDPHDEENWSDEDMYQLFEEKAHRYERNSGDKPPRKLYDFNIVDKSRKLAPESLPDDNAPIVQRLLYNSGLASVELEIANYAFRYAQYIKARESIKYLEQAMEICERKLKKKIGARDKKLEIMLASYQVKEQELTKSVLEFTNSKQKVVLRQFQLKIQQILTEFKMKKQINAGSDILHRVYIRREFEAYWKYPNELVKAGKMSLDEAYRQMENHVSQEFNKLLDEITSAMNQGADDFWKKTIESFRQEISRIVLDSNALNEDQKTLLNQVIFELKSISVDHIDIKLEKNKGIRRGLIFFVHIGKETYDNASCCESFMESFIQLSDKIQKETIDYYSNLFHEWTETLLNLIIGGLGIFNKELSDTGTSILELQHDISELNEDKRTLTDALEYIHSLIEVHSA